MNIISNSRISTYNLCKKMDYYAYTLGIQPKHMKDSFYRGTVGHKALEEYYNIIKLGETALGLSNIETAEIRALSVIQDELKRVTKEEPENTNRIKILIQLNSLIKQYAAHYKVEPFRVLETEKVYTAPITDNIDFGLILDLLIEFTSGPQRGDIVVVDHKFVYNFKSVAELEMDAQLPKYIKAVRANGYFVTKGIFNQIRYRSLKDPNPSDIFQRTPVRTDKIAMATIWEEQKDTALEIVNNPGPSRRSQNSYICKGCEYAEPCKAQLSGLDITNMLAVNYKKRERPLEALVSDD